MRRLAYMACGVVLLPLAIQGPAVAGERVDVWASPPCNRPIAQMTVAQLNSCRELQSAAEDLIRLTAPDPRDNYRGVQMLRGTPSR